MSLGSLSAINTLPRSRYAGGFPLPPLTYASERDSTLLPCASSDITSRQPCLVIMALPSQTIHEELSHGGRFHGFG
jgi:hypothetical protein